MCSVPDRPPQAPSLCRAVRKSVAPSTPRPSSVSAGTETPRLQPSALPEITEEDARNFVEQRHSEETLTSLELALPNGEVAMARGRGLTYSILAKATMPNGIWDQIEATVRLGGGSDGRPYRVLRWKEGFHH